MLPTDLPQTLAAAVGLTDLDAQVETLARIPDRAERLRYVMAWPALLAPAVRSGLREDLARRARLTDAVRNALGFLDEVAGDFHEHRVEYMPGAGSIDRVWTAQVTGTISEEDVEAVLRSEQLAATLFEDYVLTMCAWMLGS